jgi:hypothetical protein
MVRRDVATMWHQKHDTTTWRLHLMMMSGREDVLEISPWAATADLFALVAKRLAVNQHHVQLMLDDLKLRKHPGRQPHIAWRTSWLHTFNAPQGELGGNEPLNALLMPSQAEPDGENVVIEFQPQFCHYESRSLAFCIAEALPSVGISAVAFKVEESQRMLAFGLHSHPGPWPRDMYKTVAKIGGLILFDFSFVRHKTRTIDIDRSWVASIAMEEERVLPRRSTMLLVLDQARKLVRFSVLCDGGTTASTLECDLPEILWNRELFPVLMQPGMEGSTKIQISAVDPDDWPADSFTLKLAPWAQAKQHAP